MIYPESLRPGIAHNDDYTVRVRVPGGKWKDLCEYMVHVDIDNKRPQWYNSIWMAQ